MTALRHAPARRAAFVEVEDFRGDFAGLASVMEGAWSTNSNVPFLYTADFLADCFGYPGAGFSLAPAIYREEELVAFVAGFPRRVRIAGQERRLLIVAFLTAAQQYRNSGYGIIVWSELMKRAAAGGFDGVINYCVAGDPMIRMIDGSARRIGLPISRVSSFSYMSRVLWPKSFTAARRECSIPPELLMRAAAPCVERLALARIWSAEEASWHLRRLGSVTACGGTRADPAVLTGYVMAVADRRRTKCLIVENVFWGPLAPGDRRDLLREFLGRAAADGAQLAILPLRGYEDSLPFAEAGFRPSQKRIHAHLSLWSGPMPDDSSTGIYLDVF